MMVTRQEDLTDEISDVLVGAYPRSNGSCDATLVEGSFPAFYMLQGFGPSAAARKRPPVKLQALQDAFVPKTVVVAGLPRTGSTTLLMIAQIWLILADRDFYPLEKEGRTTEPWFPFFDQEQIKRRGSARRESLLLKTHRPFQWIMESADVILSSHRRPVEQMLSMQLSWNARYTCDALIQKQHDIYISAADSGGQGVAYDMSLERLLSSRRSVLKEVAIALGIPEESLSEKMLDYVDSLLMAHLPNANSVTWDDTPMEESQQRWSQELHTIEAEVTKNSACEEFSKRGGAYQSPTQP